LSEGKSVQFHGSMSMQQFNRSAHEKVSYILIGMASFKILYTNRKLE